MTTLIEPTTPVFRHQSDEHQAVLSLEAERDGLGSHRAILSVPTAQIHPAHASLTAVVDQYFLERWPFPTSSAAERWRDEQHVLWVCYQYPFAIDDKGMDFASRLIVLLTLNDDRLDELSMKDGSATNIRLFEQMMHQNEANLTDPTARIAFELFADMRANDPVAANLLLDAVRAFLTVQTDKTRLQLRSLADYFEYRLNDVGRTVLISLLRYVMDLHLNDAEEQQVLDLEEIAIRHITIVNDIISYGKEVRAQKDDPGVKGAELCNAISLLAQQCGELAVSIEGFKRVLWALTREFEAEYVKVANEVRPFSAKVDRYVRCLGYMMSGNAAWSLRSSRYH